MVFKLPKKRSGKHVLCNKITNNHRKPLKCLFPIAILEKLKNHFAISSRFKSDDDIWSDTQKSNSSRLFWIMNCGLGITLQLLLSECASYNFYTALRKTKRSSAHSICFQCIINKINFWNIWVYIISHTFFVCFLNVNLKLYDCWRHNDNYSEAEKTTWIHIKCSINRKHWCKCVNYHQHQLNWFIFSSISFTNTNCL